MIQIWDAGILDLNKSERPPQLSLVIAHNFGAVWKLLWCPSGCWEPEYGNQCTKKDMDDKEVLPRLGLMAVACGDGYVRILSIPHPTSLVTDQKGLQAVYKVKPVAVLSPPGEGPCIASKKSICCALGWSRTDGHQLVAGGYASGLLSIWDLMTSSPLLVIESDNRFVKLYPYLSFYAHACCVTSLMWGPVPGGRFLATCSSDRSVKIWDLEDPSIPLSVLKRGLHRDLDWVSHWCGIFVCIDECFNLNKTQTFYKECGYFNYILRVISAHNSTVWKVAVSDWLNVEASCDDAGEVVGTVLCQLMKNVDSLKYICHRRFPIYRIELECLEPRKSDDQPTPARIDNGENSVQEEESVNNTDVKESTTPVNTDISRECLTVNQSLDDQDEAVTTCQMKPKLPDRQKDNSHPKQTEVIEEKSEAPVILSTYKEMSNVFGLVLKDINLENMKDIPQQECKRLIRPESMNVTSLNQYPLTSVNTVVWNPNLKSHLWLLSAGQAGLVRITCLSGLHAPSASTIISKIETENS
ncbi:general transcription factor 3C polypeptide 2-like [Tachypleus tridentatus]|uniref:general transcription factor 3C polypeptide 2-like n=1 Tax=Tachypleus tridentatus TaxID=6853 RepID=UPI003FD32F17